MIRQIRVTVAYPVTFEIEIDDSEDILEIKSKIYDQADYYFESSGTDPIITESDALDDEPLIDLID
jgi:hypothetical protein